MRSAKRFCLLLRPASRLIMLRGGEGFTNHMSGYLLISAWQTSRPQPVAGPARAREHDQTQPACHRLSRLSAPSCGIGAVVVFKTLRKAKQWCHVLKTLVNVDLEAWLPLLHST